MSPISLQGEGFDFGNVGCMQEKMITHVFSCYFYVCTSWALHKTRIPTNTTLNADCTLPKILTGQTCGIFVIYKIQECSSCVMYDNFNTMIQLSVKSRPVGPELHPLPHLMLHHPLLGCCCPQSNEILLNKGMKY